MLCARASRQVATVRWRALFALDMVGGDTRSLARVRLQDSRRVRCPPKPVVAVRTRLTAIMTLMTGVYHLEPAQGVEMFADIVGVGVPSAHCAAEARVGAAAWLRVREAEVKQRRTT